MLTPNDLKKGDRIRLANGWFATLADNRKGLIRLATVEGFCTETGSIYAKEIYAVLRDGKWLRVQLDDKAKKKQAKTDALMQSIFG